LEAFSLLVSHQPPDRVHLAAILTLVSLILTPETKNVDIEA